MHVLATVNSGGTAEHTSNSMFGTAEISNRSFVHSFGNHKHVFLFANIKCSDMQDVQLHDMALVPN